MTVRSRLNPRIVSAVLWLAVGFGWACKDPVSLDLSGPTPTSTTATVTIRSTGFEPALVFLRPGGTLTFDNQDSASHTTISDTCTELGGISIAAGSRVAIRMSSATKTCGYRDQAAPTLTGAVQLCSEIQGLLGPCR